MNSTSGLSPTPNILFPNKLKKRTLGATAGTPLLGATAPNPFDAVAAPSGSLGAASPSSLLGTVSLTPDQRYNSNELLEKSIDIYGGLEYLTLVLFSIVQNYDTLLKKISVDLNTNRRGYNKLLSASERVSSCIKKLRKVSAGGDQKLVNPKTCVETDDAAVDTFKANPAVDTLKANSAVDTLKANSAVDTLKANPVVDTLKANSAVDTLKANPVVDTFKANSAVDAGLLGVTYKYPGPGIACTGEKCLLTDDDLQGLVDVVHTLDPASKITVKGLKINGDMALSLSKIKEINDDAQQRLVYMNAVSVQKGGLIQAAETNYQIVVQFSAGIIAVIKTVGGAIAQRI